MPLKCMLPSQTVDFVRGCLADRAVGGHQLIAGGGLHGNRVAGLSHEVGALAHPAGSLAFQGLSALNL